jgi:ABC-type phosphate transport system substrate-binding protein
MRSLPVRHLIMACTISAAAVVALVAPGAASASLGTQCSGSNILGEGSSLQKFAQQTVWNPDFNTSSAKAACNGKQGTKAKPTVKYAPEGSGAGLKSWGAQESGHFEGARVSFVGTDEAPDAKQKEEIESFGAKETLLTIPVLQASVAIIVHLPNTCTATSSKEKGRLELDNLTLEKIYRGTITKWNEIIAAETANGDTLTCTEASQANSAITRVVRFDESGTTFLLKKYLYQINMEKNVTGGKSWLELAEGHENTVWPGTVVRPTEKGTGPLVKLTAETAGSISYANLADARKNGAFTPPSGGAGTALFWAPVQDNGLATSKEKYADPSTDKDSASLASSNCAGTVFVNGTKEFPPPSVKSTWNEVTSQTTEKKYSLCGLTYDIALTKYSAYPGTTLAATTTAQNFLHYVVEKSGGEKNIKNQDYLALPKGEVQEEAEEGASLIQF